MLFSHEENRTVCHRLALYSFILVGLLACLSLGCYDAGAHNRSGLYKRFSGLDDRNNQRHHLRRNRLHKYHNGEVRRVMKRCRYTEHELQLDRSYASKIDDNYNRHFKVKTHQIRDQGQGKPLHFGDSSNVHENKHTEQPEVESIFVSIGDTVNLTCNIAIPEVDWHFKDTNLTTTILSYGVQLLVNQAIIYTAMDSNIINDENFQDIQYPSSNDEILKYRLSSDMHFKHQLTLYIESSKDEGSYQCVDSKSETPVKKTIHVILSKTTLYIAKK